MQRRILGVRLPISSCSIQGFSASGTPKARWRVLEESGPAEPERIFARIASCPAAAPSLRAVKSLVSMLALVKAGLVPGWNILPIVLRRGSITLSMPTPAGKERPLRRPPSIKAMPGLMIGAAVRLAYCAHEGQTAE